METCNISSGEVSDRVRGRTYADATRDLIAKRKAKKEVTGCMKFVIL